VSLASCNTKWFIVAPFDKVRKMQFQLASVAMHPDASINSFE
jgi:hypothetical protein